MSGYCISRADIAGKQMNCCEHFTDSLSMNLAETFIKTFPQYVDKKNIIHRALYFSLNIYAVGN